MSISQQLQELPTPVLIALLDDLYGRYEEIDEIIASYLEPQADRGEGPEQPSLLPWLEKQTERLLESDEFIDYCHAAEFAAHLDRLLMDIGALSEQDVVPGLVLLDRLLKQSGRLFERVDDSDGEVHEVLCGAVDLWLEMAARLRKVQPQARQWTAEVLAFHETDEYGCFDDIIGHSRDLLTEDELLQLARSFESQIRSTTTETDKGGHRRAVNAGVGLGAVALALQDIGMYEQSVLLLNPVPNTQQLERLIEYALSISALERAAHWLQQPQWQGDQRGYRRLYNRLLECRGDITQLKQNLLQAFQQTLSSYNLQAYWEHADSDEKRQVSQQVLDRIDSLTDRQDALQLLFLIDAVEVAADYLVRYRTELKGAWYGQLLAWLEQFERTGQTLAVILCYRLLLTDLLDRGYSKAYHHGARYFRTLLALDAKQPDYRDVENAQEFIAGLQAAHWRKRSFWGAADYPNKPTG